MSFQSTTSEGLEGRESAKLQECENNELFPSSSQNPQIIPDSESEVDEMPDDKPGEALSEGSVQSDCNEQTNPPPIAAEPPSMVTVPTETTTSDKQVDETSDESFILEFARLCADRPGERSWLSQIQRQLPSQMRPLLPLLLVFISSQISSSLFRNNLSKNSTIMNAMKTLSLLPFHMP